MHYSQETIKEALDADNQKGKLHREMLTVEDMLENEQDTEERTAYEKGLNTRETYENHRSDLF